MELRKMLLFHLFSAYEMNQEDICGMMTLLQTQAQQEKMLEWIRCHTNATKYEVAQAGLQISLNLKPGFMLIH